MIAKVSIIICAFNRANFVKQGLEALNNQTANKQRYEIIVVDNNSKDETKEICERFICDYPKLNLRYVLETQQGLSFARNRGINEAQTNIISYIDDDAIARNDFVENILSAFDKNPDFDALGGRVEPIYENGKEPRWMSKYVFGIVSKVDYGNTEKEFPSKFPTGCNMAFRKRILKKYGGFNTDIVYRGDEKYIFLKLKENNVRILYAPNIFVNHYIEEYRTTSAHIDKVSRSVGASEKIRLQSKSPIDRIKKFFEYFYKIIGALVLFISFSLRGQFPKGRYAVKIIWQTIVGYYSKTNYSNL